MLHPNSAAYRRQTSWETHCTRVLGNLRVLRVRLSQDQRRELASMTCATDDGWS